MSGEFVRDDGRSVITARIVVERVMRESDVVETFGPDDVAPLSAPEAIGLLMYGINWILSLPGPSE